MRSSIGVRPKSPGGGMTVGMIKPEYRKDYNIPVVPYQIGGVLPRSLWTSKLSEIRIVPGVDEQTGAILPQNIHNDQYGGTYADAGLESPDINISAEQALLPPEHFISDTFIKVTTVSQFGPRNLQFITDYAPGSEDANKYGGGTIAHHFIRNIMYSTNLQKGAKPRIKPHPEWTTWTSLQGILKYDKPTILFQGLAFVLNGLPIQDENRNPLRDEYGNQLPLYCLIFVDNRSAQTNLMNALTTPANRALPLDGKTNSPYCGIAEADGVMTYFVPGIDTEKRRTLNIQLNENPRIWNPKPYPLTEEQIKSMWVPWEKLLHFLTADEQCLLLAAEFGADTVNYVLANEPNLAGYTIPEEVARAGMGRYAHMGAKMPGGRADLSGMGKLGGYGPPQGPPQGLPPQGLPPQGLPPQGLPATYPQQAPSQGLQQPQYPQAPSGLSALPKTHAPDPVSQNARNDAMTKMVSAGVNIPGLPIPPTDSGQEDLSAMAADLINMDDTGDDQPEKDEGAVESVF